MRSTSVFYGFTFFHRLAMGATCTLYIPWLTAIGLSFSQIALLNAIFWTSTLLLELPTGMLADGRGRGFSVTVGTLFWGLGGLFYSTVSGFSGAVMAEITLSLGAAFVSGALNAWIADAKDRKEPLRKVYAHATFLGGLAMVVSPLIAVMLTQATFPSAFWVMEGSLALVASFIGWRFMFSNEPEHTLSEFEALRHAWAHLRRSSSLRWAIAVQASMGLFGAFNMYWTLLLVTRFSAMQISWIWAVMYGSLALAGWLVRSRHGAGLHGATGMILALAAGGVPMFLFGVLPYTVAWLVLMIVHEVGRGAFSPFADSYVAEQVESGYRATYGSLQSFIGSLGMVATLLASSLYMSLHDSDPATILQWWFWIGLMATVLSIVLWRLRPKM